MNHWTRLRRAAVLLSTVCAFVLAITANASALVLSPTSNPLPGSNFQGGDGNQANGGGFVDWQAQGGIANFVANGGVHLQDNNLMDTTFEGGDKETEPYHWFVNQPDGAVTPSKSNLLEAWVKFTENTSGAPATFLNLAFTRQTHTGDTHAELELYQKPSSFNWVNDRGQVIPCRTNGDLLISYEVLSGGNPPNVEVIVYKWQSETTQPLLLPNGDPNPNGPGCGRTGEFTEINPAPYAQGAINAAQIPTNYLPTNGDSTFAAGTFMETSINLTGIFSLANLNPCTQFGQVGLASRSSTSVDSQLQDLLGPVGLLTPTCGVKIVKTGSPTTVHDGDDVTYSYDVTSTGNQPVTVNKVTGVTDDKCSPVTYLSGDTDNDGLLEKGETWKFDCDYVADHADETVNQGESHVVNTATVNGTVGVCPGAGCTPVSDTDTWSTKVIHPAINVEKSGTPTTVHDGDSVTYSYDVTLPTGADTPLENVSVTDDRCSPVTYVSGDTNGDDWLDVGETWKYTCDYTVDHADENASKKVVNEATAVGTDELGETVDDDDTFEIQVIHPGITVKKSATPATVHAGETISYSIEVENTGDTSLTVTPTDTGCDSFDSSVFTLAAGAKKTLTCTKAAPDAASYDNEVCVEGKDSIGDEDTPASNTDGTVNDCDTVTTEIIEPDIVVEKSGTPTTVHDGDSVTYSYDVTTGTGDTPLQDVSVVDDKCSPVTYVSGDTNGDDWLDLNETWKYTCSYTVDHADEDQDHKVVNKADAEGYDKLDTKVTDDDTFEILVIHPGITVKKSATPATVHAGETISYSIEVENTGDTSLTVTPTDTGCDSFDSSVFTLAAGAKKTLTCTKAAPDAASYDNEVCVEGKDSIGDEDTPASNTDGTVNDCDTVTTEIIKPAIHVEKSGTPTTVHDGDSVTYSYDVTIPTTGSPVGDTPLKDVAVTDDKCSPVTYVSGDTNGDDWLDLGETWKFTCAYTVDHGDENGSKKVVNEATAVGTDKLNTTVDDDDTFEIQVIHPDLAIDKKQRLEGQTTYVNDTLNVRVGDKVEYEIRVTNPGDTPMDVTDFTDNECQSLTGPSGDDGNDLLDTTETWIYLCSHVITDTDPRPYENTALVTAEDTHGGDPITKDDSVQVNVLNFSISGMKFEDKNANGQRDAGDPPIADWTIYLDMNSSGDMDAGDVSTKTAADGTYSFAGLNPGTYVVREDIPSGSGWHCSAPSANFCFYQVRFTSTSSDRTGIDFGNWQDSSVSGVKFHDRDGDGAAREANEEGLAGWQFYVDYNGNGQLDSGEPNATSGADGSYTIGGIKPGAFAVREVGQASWTCSFPGTCDYALSFVSGDRKTGADFGNWEPASVAGSKYQDTNGNGQPDAGEGPLQGFTFYVDYNANGALDSGEPSAVSAADGNWTITGVKPGSFSVREVADPNFTCTEPAAGCAYPVTLEAGQADTGKRFGNQPPAQIVAGERVTPGSARLLGPTGCVAKAFNARIRGSKVATVTFILDGKTVKRIRKPNSRNLYTVRINPAKLKVGVHRLVVSVTFQAGSNTKPRRLRLSFQRCARKLAAPRFTG